MHTVHFKCIFQNLYNYLKLKSRYISPLSYDPHTLNYKVKTNPKFIMEHEDLEELTQNATDYLAWVSKDDIPDPLPIFSDYYEENYFGEESSLVPSRLDEIENGAKATDEECKTLLDSLLSKISFGDFHGERMVKSMAFISPHPTIDPNNWMIISTEGTSFEGTYSEIYGKFPTKESAIESLCENGYLEGYIG